jgi:hypothetical protein
LEVTVLDENRNRVYDFLGKIEIPLTNVSFDNFFHYGIVLCKLNNNLGTKWKEKMLRIKRCQINE